MTLTRRYTVAETAATCGISTSALIRYVKRGLIPPPEREGSRRTYGQETIDKIPAIRAQLRDARIQKLAKAPAVPVPNGRLTVAETAEQAEISINTLGRLKRAGLIPQPERCGRSLTYPADLVPAIKKIVDERKIAANAKRSEHMKERWQDQGYRDLATFGMSKPKKRTAPQTFSPEFLAHQGQLKDPKIQAAAKRGQQEFLKDPQRVDAWKESLAIAQNDPGIRENKRAAMKRHMRVKNAASAAVWRPSDWNTWRPEDQMAGVLLLENPGITNAEIGQRMDERSRLRCPFGDSWERALTRPGTGANWIASIRKKLNRPAR